jgi:serine/threonine-protein kinase
MGEVYRAQDTKLARGVAIKILPESLGRDPERLSRFEREARVLASLNHPNIAQIYGIEDRALIMELVEGQNLAQVKTPLPLATALDYAGQIASALSAAHDKGITHRDLKPANIMVTPEGVIKVLDFGLAAQTRESTAGNTENSPTLTIGSTQAGVILGTAAYMSPEQASGQAVDRRSDIWSFGVVLLEMLTGQRTFTGDTISHVLAAVLTKDPDVKSAPFEVQRLLRACFQRDVRQRLQSIGDWRHLMDSAAPPPAETAAATPVKRSPWILTGVAVLAIALAAVSWMWWRASRPVDHPLIRVSVDLGPDAIYGPRTSVAISPDGTRIVYSVRRGGTQQLATRLLNQSAATLLPGTENSIDPFFNFDGQWIGFSSDGRLKKISVLGGASVTIADAPAMRGASWGADDNIIFTPSAGAGMGLFRIPAAGGKPQALTKPGDRGEATHRWPQVLPGGQVVLFTGSANSTSFDNASIEALTLKTGQIKVLQPGGYFGRYFADNRGEGHLVYIHEGVLFGVPFDPDTLQVRGAPSPLLEDVAADASTAGGQLDFSNTGTVAYRVGKPTGSTYLVVTLDSSGKTEPLVPELGNYFMPRFSPDGKRLALSVTAGKGTDINVWDTQREAMSHLTFNGQENANPVWSPDGKHIVFHTAANGGAMMWVRADGAGDAQTLYHSKSFMWPSSFSPDGRRLAFSEQSAESNVDVWTLPLDLADPEHPKAGKPEKFWASPQVDAVPMFSPNGHWIAYFSNEDGQGDIFVRPFPGPGGVWQISVGGGTYPFWSPDGKQLFYKGAANRVWVVDYSVKGDTFTPGKPREWSPTATRTAGGNQLVPIDLAPDGKHFAIFPVTQGEEEKGSAHVTFLFNFFDELRRRAEK